MFVAVVGPSGAGKDSLIETARTAFAGDPRFHFVKRHITRPHDCGGENHHEISVADFDTKAAESFFVLDWSAHGLRYGIPRDVARHIANGEIVVANLSRATVPGARTAFSDVRVVHVTAPPEVLAGRLAARGRETQAAVEARLSRDADTPEGNGVHEIVNDGDLADAAAEFIATLRGFAADSQT
jgi:ribose 1,5-bisphosphokinase